MSGACEKGVYVIYYTYMYIQIYIERDTNVVVR